MDGRWTRGGVALAVAALALCAAPGCGYLRCRGQDALDMFDLGLTFTSTPQFGIYGNCPFIAPGGYAKVEGHYVGVGGGKVGVLKHRQDAVGLVVWGREDVRWARDDGDGGSEPSGCADTCCRPETPQARGVGPLGYATTAEGKPGYRPQCAHYLHLGFVGVTANLNYRQWGDFLLGWFGFDINGDDWRASGTTPSKAQEPVLADAWPPPKTEFCTRCGGRRLAGCWPPVPAGELRMHGIQVSEHQWAGRWCECWSPGEAAQNFSTSAVKNR